MGSNPIKPIIMKIFEAIDNELTAKDAVERESHKKREPGIFYASEAMQCQRKIYIDVMHPERKTRKMPLGLFHMAKLAEKAIVECLHATPGIVVQEQVGLKLRVAPHVMIHGYKDIQLLNDDGDIIDIFEIKSIGNISYILKATEAKLHHRSQLQCYLQEADCNSGGIIYVERGDIGKVKQFDDTKDENLWDRITIHFTEISDYMNDKNIPPPIPVESWECKYCEFANECKEERKQLGIKLK
jgi:CRISPR/Cas system-associated exonuclease Cas4 (RecB family)